MAVPFLFAVKTLCLYTYPVVKNVYGIPSRVLEDHHIHSGSFFSSQFKKDFSLQSLQILKLESNLGVPPQGLTKPPFRLSTSANCNALLSGAQSIVTNFLSEGSDVPVKIRGSFECRGENGELLLWTTEGFEGIRSSTVVRFRQAFNSDALAREECERAKRIAGHMKDYHVIDSDVLLRVSANSILWRVHIVNPDLWTTSMRTKAIQGEGYRPSEVYKEGDCGSLQQ
eukprot:292553-Rhodomonas_salina.1